MTSERRGQGGHRHPPLFSPPSSCTCRALSGPACQSAAVALPWQQPSMASVGSCACASWRTQAQPVSAHRTQHCSAHIRTPWILRRAHERNQGRAQARARNQRRRQKTTEHKADRRRRKRNWKRDEAQWQPFCVLITLLAARFSPRVLPPAATPLGSALLLYSAPWRPPCCCACH